MFDLIAFAVVNLLGAMSPGPDFAIVTRYGLSGSRRSAFLATMGIGTALLIHVLYCLLGIAIFLQNSPRLFLAIQFGGAAYLGYLGIKLIAAKAEGMAETGKKGKPFVDGFLTNLLNPKATLFLLSIFMQFVKPGMSTGMKLAYGVTIPVIAMGWFGFLSYFLTHPRLIPHLQKYQTIFIRSMGALLIALAASVLISALF